MYVKPGLIAQTKAMFTPVSVSDAWPVLFAAVIGLALVFLAGFAETDVLHNAAHDVRHSAGFPCH